MVKAGNPGGGRWTSTGGSGGGTASTAGGAREMIRRDETYGTKNSVRIDVFENVGNGTVCVYDIKTGKRRLSLPRSIEIATKVHASYPGIQRILVIETRPIR